MRTTFCLPPKGPVDFTWIDIREPDQEELGFLSEEFQIPRNLVLDCLIPDHLPKFEDGPDMDFLLVRKHHWPVGPEDDTIQELSTKVAIFYNNRNLITIHRTDQPFLRDIYKEVVEPFADRQVTEVITRILIEIVRSYERPLITLAEQIDLMEDEIFLRHNTRPDLQRDLYLAKRKAGNIRKLLYLTSLASRKLQSSPRDQAHINDLHDLIQKLDFEADQVHDDAENLLNTYLAITAHRTNDIMRVLTIFSVFFMPLTFIVGIYGMNFEYMPELGYPIAYPLVWAVMLGIIATIFIWFRKNRWI